MKVVLAGTATIIAVVQVIVVAVVVVVAVALMIRAKESFRRHLSKQRHHIHLVVFNLDLNRHLMITFTIRPNNSPVLGTFDQPPL